MENRRVGLFVGLLACALGLSAATIGGIMARHARDVSAPVRDEAYTYIRNYILTPNEAYGPDLGRPQSVQDIACERLFATYSTFSDAFGRKNQQLVAVCHADVQFERRKAAIAINISRRSDSPGQWNVFKFDIDDKPR